MIPAEEFRALKILHRAMCTGPVLMAGIFYYLSLGNTTLGFEPIEMCILGSVFAFFSIMMAPIMYRKLLDRNKGLDNSQEIVQNKRAAYIMKWALLEGSTLMNLVFFMFTDNLYFLLIAALLWSILFANKPSEDFGRGNVLDR